MLIVNDNGFENSKLQKSPEDQFQAINFLNIFWV